jgi:hypothetical protein
VCATVSTTPCRVPLTTSVKRATRGGSVDGEARSLAWYNNAGMQSDVAFTPSSLLRRVRVALVVWLAMLGLDFLLNGALFAGMYKHGGPFMLAPSEAFRRIPFGYLAFLILAIGIVEIAYRLRVARIADGIRLGLLIGGVLGAVWGLGLYSIATLGADVALAFAVIWLSLALLGSAVAAAGLAGSPLRGLVLRVGAFDVLCVVIVIGLQSLGVVPTTAP